MYTYYKEIQREEHLLFAEEIYEMYKSYFTIEKPISIHTMIKKYAKVGGIEVEKLYYQTSKGLKRVYDLSLASRAIKYHLINKKRRANNEL